MRWLEARPRREVAFLESSGFKADEGDLRLIGSVKGGVGSAILGLGTGADRLALAHFSENLPEGTYELRGVPDSHGGENAAIAWALGTYRFDRYKKSTRKYPRLVLPDGVDGADVSRIAEGVFLARDLVNTPANDMGPEQLACAARDLARHHGAKLAITLGDNLLKKNYPLIHAVGRASTHAPRLIEFNWGKSTEPKLTLVGKGVCFDTGGIDIKRSSDIAIMKKDMGGAAVVLGLAHMIMDAKLAVRLRVLIPAVENSVSGNAYRPGDVFKSRKGLTVEIGNTDAEGRLVLADALADGDDEAPDLMIDVATLTGAARAATGFDLPPFFTDDEALAADLYRAGNEVSDHVWRLPLWRGYESAIASPIADLNNAPDYGLAGAITAALFLNRFVTKSRSWMHLDIPAWIDRPKPGRRKGAEANTARALYAMLRHRYPPPQ